MFLDFGGLPRDCITSVCVCVCRSEDVCENDISNVDALNATNLAWVWSKVCKKGNWFPSISAHLFPFHPKWYLSFYRTDTHTHTHIFLFLYFTKFLFAYWMKRKAPKTQWEKSKQKNVFVVSKRQESLLFPGIFHFIYNVCDMRMCVGNMCPYTGLRCHTILIGSVVCALRFCPVKSAPMNCACSKRVFDFRWICSTNMTYTAAGVFGSFIGFVRAFASFILLPTSYLFT